MKRILAILIACFYCAPQLNAALTGMVQSVVKDSSGLDRSYFPYIVDSKAYTTGGAIFTYPSGITFAAAPTVRVTIGLNGQSVASNTTYIALVTATSITGCTIYVHKIVDNGVLGVNVTQAAAGDVLVYILAVGVGTF